LKNKLVWLAALLALAACQPAPQATATQLDQLASQCTSQMVAQTCRAMTPGNLPKAQPGEIVMVAGLGPIDAQLLVDLRNAGAQMCSDVRHTCEQNWHGKPCAAYKAMYAPELATKQ
jgi:hypothetical protein